MTVKWFEEGRNILVYELLSLTTSIYSGTLSGELSGGFLHEVELITSADEAVGFTLTSELGVPLFSGSWTAAHTGEEPKVPTHPFAIGPGDSVTYELTGLGSGTASVKVYVLKK